MSVIMFNCIDLNSVCTASWANHLAVMQLLCCFFVNFIFIIVIIRWTAASFSSSLDVQRILCQGNLQHQDHPIF